MTYEQYLKSNGWREFKDGILAERLWKCDKCGFGGSITAIHINKTKFAEEDPNNIILKCKSCREKLEKDKIIDNKKEQTKTFKKTFNYEKSMRLELAMKNWKQVSK